MGNATTFPIQSIVYALICISACLDFDGKTPSYRKVQYYASKVVRVYGDDIIINKRYFDYVVQWLQTFGFIVNGQKSFSKGYFRESCGVDAYMGVDITPIYVRHWPKTTNDKNAKTICSLVSASNQFWLKCYYETATVIQSIIEERIGTLPLVTGNSSALGWHTRSNIYSIERWNKILHRFEYRSWVPKSKRFKDPLSGYPALLKFFHMRLEDGCSQEIVIKEDHLEYSDKRYSSVLSRRWCAI